jgi:CheY-like chemotaxis protein
MRVLFVEDDPMNRSVVRDMLTIVEVAMAEATDAETGLRMIDDEDYDAILMDLRMPGMDGLDAIRHIRARGDAKGKTPIIVITADMAHDLPKRCRDIGADHVLSKPVPMDALFDTLSEVIDGRANLIA